LSRAFEVHYRLNIHSAGAKDFIRAEIAIEWVPKSEIARIRNRHAL
jgi:hypothetical protein